jgi:hypothetical protein
MKSWGMVISTLLLVAANVLVVLEVGRAEQKQIKPPQILSGSKYTSPGLPDICVCPGNGTCGCLILPSPGPGT